MTSKERLDAFYAGEPVDRLPNLTIVGSVVTRYNGIDIEQYSKDPIAMADAAILAAKDLELDFVQIASDLTREAEGYGSVIEYFADELPRVGTYALGDIHEVENLKPLKAREIPRLFDLVTATEYALKKEPDIWPMTLAVGPMTVAGNIRGVEMLMMDLFDAPELVDKLLDIATETTLDLIRELAAVGAKYMYVADPVASLMGPAFYQTSVLRCHKRIFDEMKAHGIQGRLHMCGDTTAILPFSRDCGAVIIDIDHATDYAAALAAVEGHCILSGNIDPVSEVFSCDAETTKQALHACHDAACGCRALFMPGCELPTKTPIENVKAIAAVLAEIGAVK